MEKKKNAILFSQNFLNSNVLDSYFLLLLLLLLTVEI